MLRASPGNTARNFMGPPPKKLPVKDPGHGKRGRSTTIHRRCARISSRYRSHGWLGVICALSDLSSLTTAFTCCWIVTLRRLPLATYQLRLVSTPRRTNWYPPVEFEVVWATCVKLLESGGSSHNPTVAPCIPAVKRPEIVTLCPAVDGSGLDEIVSGRQAMSAGFDAAGVAQQMQHGITPGWAAVEATQHGIVAACTGGPQHGVVGIVMVWAPRSGQMIARDVPGPAAAIATPTPAHAIAVHASNLSKRPIVLATV